MAAQGGKSLRSRTLPTMEESSQAASQISPVAKERRRLRDQARQLKERGFAEPSGRRTKLNFVPDSEAPDEAGLESTYQDAQQPFDSELEQDLGHISVDEFLNKTDWSDKEIVQKALNELGVDSQVPDAQITPGTLRPPLPIAESKGKGIALTSEDEGFSNEEETTDEGDSEEDSEESEEISEAGDSEESLADGTRNLLVAPRDTAAAHLKEGTRNLLAAQPEISQAPAVSQETAPPNIDISTDSEHRSNSVEMVDVTDEAGASAGANPRAPRQFIPKPHVIALVGYYERHFAIYKHSIKPKLPSQLVPAKVWKEVYAQYKREHPNTPFKEESLKEPLRISLRDLAKAKEQQALPEEGRDPGQDEELLERLMATDSFRAKNVLQERLNVADRCAGDGRKKKRKAPGQSTSPISPRTPRPASSNISAQTEGAKSVGKVTKSQNLKDAKDGISSMLGVMTNMNEEKKLDNLRKVAFNEGKSALHDAKRRESEERAVTLVAQRSAIGDQNKLSRINLLKEQKNLGIINEDQFMEACKVVFYS